ncbi:lysylphosphatidylglycerol synthase transmembrane domain-containing protein [Corynebacterium pseudogenitalium]|uniref:lysylphosphatidylglycerol synthase transmembrane domain-containing protein n=1 Tax=Corynebacterium pseudogenitalium TaxID=38303 RepID=UPI003BA251B7
MNLNAKWLRWTAPVVILIVGLVLFRDRLPFFGEAWTTLRRADLPPLVGAVVTAFGAIAAMAAVMLVLLNIEGRIADLRGCINITLASNAWSTTVPGGPALSAWLTFRVHQSWGATTGLCAWFFVVSGALSTVWMALIGISAVVFMGARLSVWALAGSLAGTAAVVGGLYWATRNPTVLKRWLRFLPARVATKASGVVDQVAAIQMSRRRFTAAAAFSLLNQVLDLAVLYFCAWSVLGTAPGFEPGLNQTSAMGITLAFIMTKLAGAAQVTPGGVGTVEAILAGSLVTVGLTLVDATAVTVLYRLISFALITAIGWVVHTAEYAGRGYMLGKA